MKTLKCILFLTLFGLPCVTISSSYVNTNREVCGKKPIIEDVSKKITKKKESSSTPPPHADRIFEEPDIMPIFVGGSSAMHQFISSSLQYPKEAVERQIQGLVVYTFVVEKDGTLSNFDIIHRADPLLDAEALRILKSMPPWRPAKHKGKEVRSKSYVPMYFKLNKNAIRNQAANKRQCPTPPNSSVNRVDSSLQNNSDEIFTIVDKMPQYETGERGLANFISNTLRYPIDARQNGVEGRILCSFIVNAYGAISNVEVVQGLHPSLDAEAVRVLKLMPRWIPGENKGEKVNVKCLLPIDFTIDEEPIPPLER